MSTRRFRKDHVFCAVSSWLAYEIYWDVFGSFATVAGLTDDNALWGFNNSEAYERFLTTVSSARPFELSDDPFVTRTAHLLRTMDVLDQAGFDKEDYKELLMDAMVDLDEKSRGVAAV